MRLLQSQVAWLSTVLLACDWAFLLFNMQDEYHAASKRRLTRYENWRCGIDWCLPVSMATLI